MATLVQLETALVNAHNAGDSDAARKLSAIVVQERERRANDPSIELRESLPPVRSGGEPLLEQVPGTVVQEPEPEPEPEPTLMQKVQGAGDAARTMVTGLIGGHAGMVGGTIEGIIKEVVSGDFGSYEASQRIEQLAMERAEQLTRAPTTDVGREYVQNVGEALEPLAALPPVLPVQRLSGIARSIPTEAVAHQRIVQPARRQADRTKKLAQEISTKVRERLEERRAKKPEQSTAPEGAPPKLSPTQAEARQAAANELPIPIKYMEGQKTRDWEAKQFEVETSKLAEAGAPIRERVEDQNIQVQGNLENFIRQTGSTAKDPRGVGEAVDKALKKKSAKDWDKINELYTKARESGELDELTTLPGLAGYLDEVRSLESSAKNLLPIRKELIRLGGAVEGDQGNLIPQKISLAQGELLRSFIGDVTDGMDARQVRQAAKIKTQYGLDTASAGGNLIKAARAARARYAQNYENPVLIKKLLSTKKNSDDRVIALEDVLQKVILSESLDSIKKFRRLLKSEGKVGQQAWKEIQGGVLQAIRDDMLKRAPRNSRGDLVVSAPAFGKYLDLLDKNGKLDLIFTEAGAKQLRTLRTVAEELFTSPQGTVNNSGTASAVAFLMDLGMTAATGVPSPVMTALKQISDKLKDKKLKARVQATLGE